MGDLRMFNFRMGSTYGLLFWTTLSTEILELPGLQSQYRVIKHHHRPRLHSNFVQIMQQDIFPWKYNVCEWRKILIIELNELS